jgi:plastocyanin
MTRFQKSLQLCAAALFLSLSPSWSAPLVYEGEDGIGQGKHIVFLAGDHEYRSEESLPALARILAKHHGFKCTVLFNVDKTSGEITPGNSNMPGLEALDSADLAVFFLRFQAFPEEQMKHVVSYLDRGGPVVGLRTATHAFQFPKGSPFEKYSTKYEGEDYKLGFGHQVLGQTWIGHYGKNHQQSGRINVIEAQRAHPILRGVENPWVESGAYWGDPVESEILAMIQPLNGMTPDSPADASKKETPVAWTRSYKAKDGAAARVFASTAGASEDLRNEGFRRMLMNGCLWALGLEDKITADLATAFVGPFQPSTFSGGGHVRGLKPSDLAGWDSPIMPKETVPAEKPKGKKAKKKTVVADPKNRESSQKRPNADPALADYGIYAKTAPNPEKTEPLETTLPLKLEKGTRIAYVGNTLLDREQDFGYFETSVQQANPGKELVIRDFAWSADEVDLQPRPDNFATVAQHLTREKIDVVFAAFGYNESFGGLERIDEFRARLRKWLRETKTSAFNGRTGPRIVLLSPIANENIAAIPAADLNNARLAAYTEAMAEIAAEAKVGFVDLYAPTLASMVDPANDLTINGAHLNAEGYALVSDLLFRTIFGGSPLPVNEELRKVIVDKNRQYFRRYRPLNTFYYTGGRNQQYGYLDFLPAMRNFEMMAANRDRLAWDIASGASPGGKTVDDANVPPLEGVTEARGANEWLPPSDERKAFRVDPRFEVNLFASEEEFPDIACPIQMRWDARGRLWVACSTTYPHVYPGAEPNDKMVILEDTDKDGKADQSTVWADNLHIPLSFELTRNGIYVSEEPHFSLVLDTDGDGRADTTERLLTGFGTEDSHHALHDFVWTPDGDLLFRESIFHHSQVETPYGPVRAKNSAWFQFTPATQRLVTFGNYPNTNPWGVTFDDWGQHVASHPIFASAFHALNPPYPEQHPGAGKLPAYSGVCGHEFVDFPSWPAEMQGGFVKVRYKPTNRVEIHQWIEKDDHFEEKYVSDLIFSENLSFIPTDLRYGPDGAMYVCDWYNPVKGHAQYSLRDPRRDRKSGRIWRILPKGAEIQDPPAIAGAPIESLLENLKLPQYRYRYWTKRELRARDPREVESALDRWVEALDKGDPRFRHHQVEAIWLYRSLGRTRPNLLLEILACDEPHARAAATRQLRYSHSALESDGLAELAACAADTSGLVRLEAAVAASYLGTRGALDAVLPILDQPMGDHLKYALTCALGSADLLRAWQSDPALKARVEPFLKGSRAAEKIAFPKGSSNATTAQFDGQPNLATVEISCLPERMLYTKTRFSVKAGQPVKLVFTNPDATPHNLAIVVPGALEEIGMAGNEMAKDPSGMEKDFIPESDKILHHTKLLFPNTGEILRFTAPEKPGTYPYLCTFPGHWVVMKGEMVVE